ncbi:MAG: sterol desaturase family protein [Thermodesulfovibrionia bacterium]|nr:sterol desaturase family protein [Thermodesulfovibrionia bacterium]
MGNEIYIRLFFFVVVFAVMALWEMAAPRRALTTSKSVRWFSNLSITFLDSALVRWIFPIMAIDMAYLSAERGWGILNILNISGLPAGIMAIAFLDLIIYAQHMAFHSVKPLWRLHMMHHVDLDIDVTTGARFHPIEIIISMGIKMASVALLGAPPWAVLVFEALLNATSMFNHANAYLPSGIDRLVRLFLVTPDMHRVHHSVIIRETNSNYGFNLPWWDRIFKTYRAQPVKGHTDMNIGLANFRDPKKLTLPWMLAIPFLGKGR